VGYSSGCSIEKSLRTNDLGIVWIEEWIRESEFEMI